MKEKSAGIVLVHDNKVVLLKRPRYWELPKGHIEQGETELEAAKRETIEETGIKDFRIVPGWKIKIKYSYWFNKKKIEKEVVFFMGIVDKYIEPKPSKEHPDAKWIDIDKAIKIVKFNDLREVLEKVKQNVQRINKDISS